MSRASAAAAVFALCLPLLPTAVSAAPAPATCAGRTATIRGTDGYDTLRGTSGPDVISAGPGKDVIIGAGGDDVICAGSGIDKIYGQRGLDRVYAGSGADHIHDPGNAIVYGSTGGDGVYLDRPGSRSAIYGGYDPDLLVVGAPVGDFVIDGGMGQDKFHFGHFELTVPGDVTIDLLSNRARSADARLEIPDIEGARSHTGNDTLYGSNGRNWLHGGDFGDDTIFGRAGDDELWGGEDADTLTGGDGHDTCYDDNPDDPANDIDCETVILEEPDEDG